MRPNFILIKINREHFHEVTDSVVETGTRTQCAGDNIESESKLLEKQSFMHGK